MKSLIEINKISKKYKDADFYAVYNLDLSIQENEIFGLLEAYTNIHSVIFNGKTAEKFYKKYYKFQKSISYYSLPSTSPANARKTFNEKLIEWTIIKELLK